MLMLGRQQGICKMNSNWLCLTESCALSLARVDDGELWQMKCTCLAAFFPESLHKSTKTQLNMSGSRALVSRTSAFHPEILVITQAIITSMYLDILHDFLVLNLTTVLSTYLNSKSNVEKFGIQIGYYSFSCIISLFKIYVQVFSLQYLLNMVGLRKIMIHVCWTKLPASKFTLRKVSFDCHLLDIQNLFI